VSDNSVKQAFSDLLAYLEFLETQTRALLHLLKDKGIVTEEKLAPYLEQASKESDIRMRAARARIDHLFNADDEVKPATEASETVSAEAARRDKTAEKTVLRSPKQKDAA
jgi:hypothetical protein